MSAFWANARKIMEVASAADSEIGPSDLGILIARDGAIRMVDAAGWRLHSLQLESGAQAAYRISRDGSRVRLEGRCEGQSCVMEVETPAAIARRLLLRR